MTKIYGSLVIHNEADRYLEKVIRWNRQFLDDIFVYDDNSTDDSVLIAEELGCAVVTRGVLGPSFLQDESQFRSDAWTYFQSRIVPTEKDWVFSFDADEFIVSNEDAVRWSIERAISATDNYTGIRIPVQEVFEMKDKVPQIRVDGFWGNISSPRLFRYQPSDFNRKGKMGCGSEPKYVIDGDVSKSNCGLSLLHYGYLDKHDRIEKYNRYRINAGHSSSHIESILKTGRYIDWDGGVPSES